MDSAISKCGLDSGLEIVEVELAVLAAGPGNRSGVSSEKEGDGIGFKIGGFAAANIAELSPGFEEAEGFGALTEVVFCGGKKARSKGGAENGVIFAKRAGDFYQIAVLKRAKGKAVAELALADEFDSLSLVESECDEAFLEIKKAVVVAVDCAFVNRGAAGAGRDIFESMDTSDFFNKVDGAFEVGAPAGNVPGFAVGRREAEAGEEGSGVFE